MLVYENREDYFSVILNCDAIRKEKDCGGDRYLGRLFENMCDVIDVDSDIQTTISARNLYVSIYIRSSYKRINNHWEFEIYSFNSESEFPNNFSKWNENLCNAILSRSNKIKKIRIQRIFKKSIKAMFKKS